MNPSNPINDPDLTLDETIGVPVTHPTVDHHRRARDRKLVSSILAAALTKPLGLLAPLITTPLFLHYLDHDGYGLFATVVSVATLLSLTNAGLAQGLVNKLVACYVSDDRALARRYVSSVMLCLAAIVAVALLAWTAASLYLNWDHLLGVPDPSLRAVTPKVLCITGAGTLISLLFAAPQSILNAFQENTALAFWDGLAKLAGLVAAVLIVRTAFGIVGVAWAVTGSQALIAAACAAWIFARRTWLVPRLADFDPSLLRGTLTDGLYLLLVNVAILILFQCDKLLIFHMRGPGAVTDYDVVVRLYVIVYAAFTVLWTPLWPAYGEAVNRGDLPWVQRRLRLSILVGCGTVAAGGLTLALLINPTVRLWTRGSITHVSLATTLAIAATFLLRAWADCHSIVLISFNVFRPQAYAILLHAILNVALALILGPRFGVPGIAWSTPLTALLTTTWSYPWLVRQHLRLSPSPG
jgi:O-antigen/teichoic acid export membrane protein